VAVTNPNFASIRKPIFWFIGIIPPTPINGVEDELSTDEVDVLVADTLDERLVAVTVAVIVSLLV
jgi:hypothetical protein